MIYFRYTTRGAKKLRDLASELKYVSSSSFLRSLPTRKFADRALTFLKSVFPKSKETNTTRHPGPHLSEGWKVKVNETERGVSFSLSHDREREQRVRTILLSLDKGSRSHQYTPDDDIRFYGRYRTARGKLSQREGWVTVVQGRTMFYRARPGLDYTGKTYEYVRDVLLPEFRGLVADRIKERLKRI